MDRFEFMKPLPILEHMPPHIMQKIIGNLDYFDKVSLRNTSCGFQRAIRRPPIVADLQMKYKKGNEAEVRFLCDEYSFEKKKKYIKNELGWMIKTTFERWNSGQKQESEVQGGENLLEMMIQDFKSVLDTPKMTLNWFKFKFKRSDEFGIVPRMRDILSSLEPRLKVQKLFISTKKREEILGILPFLNPGHLKHLGSEPYDRSPVLPSFSTRTIQLERFQNLEYMNLNSLSDILPVESWWNIRHFRLEMDFKYSPAGVLAELPRILQHRRESAVYDYCDFEFNSTKSEIKNAIGHIARGPWEVDGDYETCHLPAEGENLKLNCEVSTQRMVFMRTYRGEPREEEDEGSDDYFFEDTDLDSDLD